LETEVADFTPSGGREFCVHTYNGEWEDDRKHGQGYEVWKSLKVWVDYYMGTLDRCSLWEWTTAGLKDRKAWDQKFKGDVFERDQIPLENGAWKELRLSFKSMEKTKEEAIASPALRQLLKAGTSLVSTGPKSVGRPSLPSINPEEIDKFQVGSTSRRSSQATDSPHSSNRSPRSQDRHQHLGTPRSSQVGSPKSSPMSLKSPVSMRLSLPESPRRPDEDTTITAPQFTRG